MTVGTVVRAPWRIYGDDTNLTGTVTRNDARGVVVRWHNNGSVTPEGDETRFTTRQASELDVVLEAYVPLGQHVDDIG